MKKETMTFDEIVFNGLNNKEKTYEEKRDLAMEMGFVNIPSKEEYEKEKNK